MKTILLGAVAAAGLLSGTALLAEVVPAAQPAHAGHKMMTQTELRTDVQGHVAKMFARLDTNKDGFIDKSELAAIEAQREAKVEQRADRFDPAKIFARLDTNKDGRITEAEADAARNARAAATGKPAPAHGGGGLFARLDTNKDGVVTKAEFDAAAAQMHARIEQAGVRRGDRAEHMFASADLNRDGKVSLAEMQQTALQHFDAGDANHDGKLTPDERKQARQAHRPPQKA